MKEVALLLGDMLSAQVVSNYAVFGAVAQMRYTEAVVTMDADVLVALPRGQPERLDVLEPIYRFCAERGYPVEGEAIRVGDWPVQFIPTFSALTEEALAEAQTAEVDGVPLRVVRADYLAVIAPSAGRAEVFVRKLHPNRLPLERKLDCNLQAGLYWGPGERLNGRTSGA